MSEFHNLVGAILNLSATVSNFPIGAVSLDDFKPIEQKIQDTRESLKHLNARLLILKAHKEFQQTNVEPKADFRNTVTNLHEVTASALINNLTIKSCLHSHTLQAILAGEEGDHEMQKKTNACMRKLFTLSDNILSIQEQIENAFQEQLALKIECRNALYDYMNFQKEQEQINSKKLQETNPVLAKNKEKTNKTLRTINMMKKLMISFIASSNALLKRPNFIDLLQKHRNLVTIETVLKMSQESAEDEEEA